MAQDNPSSSVAQRHQNVGHPKNDHCPFMIEYLGIWCLRVGWTAPWGLKYLKNESQIHISESLNISTLYFQIFNRTTTFVVCLPVHSTAISTVLLNSSNEFFILVIILCSSRIPIRFFNSFCFCAEILFTHYTFLFNLWTYFNTFINK